MFCKNCGRQIPDEAAFCPACGTKRSGGDTYGDERSGRNIKDLPSYAKENDLNRSEHAVDSGRKTFSLSDSGQKKFTLSNDPNRNKFSLSDSGQKKFSLSDKNKDSGDGIVRISASREPAPPPSSPTGFVNPLKESGKTVFHDEPADVEPAQSAAAKPETDTARTQPAPQSEPEVVVLDSSDAGNAADAGSDEETGFVNPLKESGQEIRWGSDGDRNETKDAGFTGDPAEIDSHMGFAILSTLCCCLPTGIAAIVFASQVSKHIQEGDYEAAKKSSDLAKLFCWISVVLSIVCGGGSSILNIFSEMMQH
jgi:hypothetical protein